MNVKQESLVHWMRSIASEWAELVMVVIIVNIEVEK